MGNLVPVAVYSPLYFHLLLVVIILTWLNSFQLKISSPTNIYSKHIFGGLLVSIIIIYIGARPISGFYFGDMGTYADVYQHYAHHDVINYTQDQGFDWFMRLCADNITVNAFFFVCAFIYVFPLFILSRKLFEQYWYYSFLILVGSFSFWAYGTNGIRNGLATSLTLLAFAYTDRKTIMIILMIVAISFHKSVLIPIAAYSLTLFYKNTKNIFIFWLICIPVSLLIGDTFQSFLGNLGIDDSRGSYLTTGNINNDDFSSTGFRWDFLCYSAIAAFSGWYFTFKREFNDALYKHLLNVYLIANGFWILIIRANFSNRFAYLSWFMMGIIIIYPLLKQQFFIKQHRVVCNTIVLYYIFTYILNAVL